MSYVIYLIVIFAALFIIELFYFRVADKYNIIDKPNERSSHTAVTIRGGGIIFPIAWLLFFAVSGFQYPWFTAGLMLISAVSFWDDINSLSNRIRLIAHLLAISLCFYELGLFQLLPLWLIPVVYVVCIGCLNAINFMDGINGITGLYALSILLSLPFAFLHYNVLREIHPAVFIILALLVFGFFNFRTRAKCFAGDAGSMSIAYILIFIILSLIFNRWNSESGQLALNTGQLSFDYKYVLLLSLYGVDAILTIVHRLILKENIFKAHRRHLYQYLANEMKWPHLAVASVYAIIQFLINLWVISCVVSFLHGILLILFLSILYIFIKRSILAVK